MKADLRRQNNSKNFLKYHIIFVCKYRKKLLVGSLKSAMKTLLEEATIDTDVEIELMESDIDHIHLLVRSIPRISISSIVRHLKQKSTIGIWRKPLYRKFLKNHFWKERTFWSDGYFVSTIGYASEETIRKYIAEQG